MDTHTIHKTLWIHYETLLIFTVLETFFLPKWETQEAVDKTHHAPNVLTKVTAAANKLRYSKKGKKEL